MLQENKLCTNPNQHARPVGMEILEESVIIHGYQEFYLDRRHVHPLANDHALQQKVKLLSGYFQPSYLKEKTFLDLGANAAYYCFWALHEGAAKVTAIDIDDDYLRVAETAKKHLGYENLEIFKANVYDWHQSADVVNALALIHWLYSATTMFGSLSLSIARLAELTNDLLIIEWVAPEDPAIQFFHHLDWNKETITEAYTQKNFEDALAQHFEKVEMIGSISETRALYAAYRHTNRVDLTCPLPRLYPGETLLSSQRLAIEAEIEYWSCVYDLGDKIVKQATLDLAAREGRLLSELRSGYFPKVLDAREEEIYSVVTFEKIEGKPLNYIADELRNNPDYFFEFSQDCLNILAELKTRGITHRDIRPANMLVRDRKPVLLDFGWAESEAHPYLTPRGLGDKEKSPDGLFCDVYSMGRVLEYYCPSTHEKFLRVIALMTAPDSYLRITEIDLLRELFILAVNKETRNERH